MTNVLVLLSISRRDIDTLMFQTDISQQDNSLQDNHTIISTLTSSLAFTSMLGCCSNSRTTSRLPSYDATIRAVHPSYNKTNNISIIKHILRSHHHYHINIIAERVTALYTMKTITTHSNILQLL